MKFISVFKTTVFSLFLLSIYWKSTLWNIAVECLGQNYQRIIYALVAIALLLTMSLVYFGSFRLLESIFSKKKKNDSKMFFNILIGIFCFKFLIFGDLGEHIDNQDSENMLEVQIPKLIQGSLKIYNVGQVKGSNGWYDIYRGFYLIEDVKKKKQYVICSKVVSGNDLKNDIINEYTNPDKLFLMKNSNISVSEKSEAQDYLNTVNIKDNTLFSIQVDGFTLFFMRLLYWGVFIIIMIMIVFQLLYVVFV